MRKDNPARDYKWRLRDYTREELLEQYYPHLAVSDPIIHQALAQLKLANFALDARMAQLTDEQEQEQEEEDENDV